MKSLLLLLVMLRVAHADGFPSPPGPCGDLAACEKACKKNTAGTCYWGGVLALQDALDEERKTRARGLFDRACKKGHAEACWQVARIIDPGHGAELADRAKGRAAYDRACKKQHARACFAFARLAALAGDNRSKRSAAAAEKKAAKILDRRCLKLKDAPACSWVADLYRSGTGVRQDPAKVDEYGEHACQITTGKPCPAPDPAHTRPRPRPRPRPGNMPAMTQGRCPAPSPGPRYQCVQDCGPPVAREGDPEPGWSWLSPADAASRREHGCPVCLPSEAMIATPRGERSITALHAGDEIWTLDGAGRRTVGRVLYVGSRPLNAPHELVQVALADGRVVEASPGHPTATGAPIGTVEVGAGLSGSVVVRVERIPYEGALLWDVLPSGTSGAYWSDGVLLRSTLAR